MFSHTCALKVSHLCIGKSKLSRNFVSVGGREIFLVKEPLLQLKDLKNIQSGHFQLGFYSDIQGL